MLSLRSAIFGVIVAVAVCQADPLSNVVSNGGFETGSFSGWTLTGGVTSCDFVGTSADSRCIPTTGLGPHTGSYAAELGNYGGDATLSQTLNTVGLGTWDVSFWLASQDYGTPANDFSVSWGGQTLMSSVNLTAFGYTFYDFSGLTASGPTTVLSFTFRNDPSYFALDDVSVVDPVPEPAPSVLFGVLLLGPLVLVLRRSKLQTKPTRR